MPLGPGLIDDELARFVRGPVAAFLATADAMAVPDATRVAGVAVLDGHRMRLLISAAARTARANAVAGARLGVLITDITTYRSVQWKGRVLSATDARTPGDLALLHHHVETFRASSHLVGVQPEKADRIFFTDVVPLVVEVDAVFDQTPGPGAGRRLEVGRR